VVNAKPRLSLDRSSRPHRSPTRTSASVEAAILGLRRDRLLGPARIAGVLGLNPSTVHRVLTRHQMARLAWIDRPTRHCRRRAESPSPHGALPFLAPPRPS
jgi:hypothetical protein